MASIALLLSNEDGQPAWVEELDVTLTELEAEDQVSPPSLRVTQKIRQLIRPGEMIPISLAGTIYKAAGEPQKWHSCVLSPSVRYRIGNEAFESVMDNYRIEMQGLIASSIRRERMKSSPLAVPKGSSDIQVAEMKSK